VNLAAIGAARRWSRWSVEQPIGGRSAVTVREPPVPFSATLTDARGASSRFEVITGAIVV